jgi:raffinose/stachyose/melibiose transport system permease protein
MLFTAAITAIPRELEESAEIDGANRLQYFFYILIPMLRVPIVSMIVVSIPFAWNQFLEPYIYLSSSNQTLLPFIQRFSGEFSTNFQVVYTGIFVSVLPLALIYLIFRGQFIRGAMSGAVKG